MGGAGGKGRELGLHSCWGTSACSTAAAGGRPQLCGGTLSRGLQRGLEAEPWGPPAPGSAVVVVPGYTGSPNLLCSRGGGELSLEATGEGVCFRTSKMPSQHALYPTRLASAQDADCSPGRWLSPGGRPWVPSAHGVAGGYSRGEDVPLASWAELSPGVQGRVGGWRSSVLTGA